MPADSGCVPVLEYTELDESAVAELAPVMREAFDDDSRLHGRGEKGGPHGYADGTFLRQWGIDTDSEAFVIRENGLAIGGLIVFRRPDSSNWLGNIFVAPSHQNRGVGRAALAYAQDLFPARIWRLETPRWATRNHRFYERSGFVRIGLTEDSVIYEKVIGH